MSNLIQYIIQDDPEEERRRQENKDELLTDNEPSADKTEKKYNFSNKNLFENRESLIHKSSSNSLSASENKPQTSNRQPTSNLASNPGETSEPQTLSSFSSTNQKLKDRMLPRLRKAEYPKDFIYIDTTWNKTTGIGANINDWNTFNKVDWRINKRPVSETEKRATFDIFQKEIDHGLKQKDAQGKIIKNNKKAEAYKNHSPLRVAENEMERWFQTHVEDDIRYLHKEFRDFASFPEGLQDVLLDIKFNTGNVSRENWPKLRKAIDQKDVFGSEGIINNVHRKDVDRARNSWAIKRISDIKEWD